MPEYTDLRVLIRARKALTDKLAVCDKAFDKLSRTCDYRKDSPRRIMGVDKGCSFIADHYPRINAILTCRADACPINSLEEEGDGTSRESQ